jgi:hypothetical protein
MWCYLCINLACWLSPLPNLWSSNGQRTLQWPSFSDGQCLCHWKIREETVLRVKWSIHSEIPIFKYGNAWSKFYMLSSKLSPREKKTCGQQEGTLTSVDLGRWIGYFLATEVAYGKIHLAQRLTDLSRFRNAIDLEVSSLSSWAMAAMGPW